MTNAMAAGLVLAVMMMALGAMILHGSPRSSDEARDGLRWCASLAHADSRWSGCLGY